MGGRRVFRTRSAQYSMEYLLIVGFAFLILSVIMVVAYSESSTFSTSVSNAQVQRVGESIVDAANTVYYAGPPTKKTMKLYFPDRVRAVSIDGGNSIVFTIEGEYGLHDYAVTAATNMTGDLSPAQGLHIVTVTALGDTVDISDR